MIKIISDTYFLNTYPTENEDIFKKRRKDKAVTKSNSGLLAERPQPYWLHLPAFLHTFSFECKILFMPTYMVNTLSNFLFITYILSYFVYRLFIFMQIYKHTNGNLRTHLLSLRKTFCFFFNLGSFFFVSSLNIDSNIFLYILLSAPHLLVIFSYILILLIITTWYWYFHTTYVGSIFLF